MSELSHRISDAEREQAVLSLRDHLLAGRLTLEEFSERVEIAYGARTGEELVRTQEGLPPGQPAPERSRRKATRITAAIFGHVERRGRLRLRRHSFAVSAFADLDLDLREAEVEDEETTISVVIGFGNVDVYVPEAVNVDVTGLTVFGHRRDWGRDVARADAPTIQVRIVGCFGTVDVWRVPSEMRGTYREVIRQLRDQRNLPA